MYSVASVEFAVYIHYHFRTRNFGFMYMHIEVTDTLIALLCCVYLFFFGVGGYLIKGYLTEALRDKAKYLRNAKPQPTKQPPFDIDEIGGTGAEWKRDSEDESLMK